MGIVLNWGEHHFNLRKFKKRNLFNHSMSKTFIFALFLNFTSKDVNFKRNFSDITYIWHRSDLPKNALTIISLRCNQII